MTTTEFQMAMQRENEDTDHAMQMLATVLLLMAGVGLVLVGYGMWRLFQ
jgi:hypothetical protein